MATVGKRDDASRRAPERSNMIWQLLGVSFGVVLTTAAVLLVSDMVRGDAPIEAGEPPLFVEEAMAAGVEHSYDGEFQYFVGGGVAVLDCNSDGFPDLYFAGGIEDASLYVNESTTGGDLLFAEKRSTVTSLDRVTGAYPLDVDSDGLQDLVVLRVGENIVLRGLGDCEFAASNAELGLEGGDDWTTAFTATWEDDESLPTLVFGNYLTSAEPGERETCASHDMFRPTHDGYGAPVELTPGWCTLSVLFSDWSGSGEQDLRMTNDRHYYRDGEEQLWRVRADQPPTLYTSDDGWESMQIWGMGIASQDVTGDGIPEVFLTSQGDNKLQTLTGDQGRPTYSDIALGAGATAHRPFLGDTERPSTAWHAEFADVNNDGFFDLFVTKGNVDEIPEFAMEDPNNLLLGQPDGTFAEGAAQAGLIDYSRSRGAALADLNLDGWLDVVVVERREPVKIWRNIGQGENSVPGNWLTIDLEQRAPNRDAIGSWIEVKLGNQILRKEVTVGGGHAGGQVGWVHFGLGSATNAQLRVIWPGGSAGPWLDVAANQFVVVDRDTQSVTSWVPARS